MKVLYISYDGATEPIPQSQVLPYLKELSEDGIQFCWLSFEKNLGKKAEIRKFKKELSSNAIKWYFLPYHKWPSLPAKMLDIIIGTLYASYIVVTQRIKIVHGRGEISSLICMILKKIFRLKFIYGRRGYMAEDYVEGGMWKSRKSLNYILADFSDKKMLHAANAIVVLTRRVKNILRKDYANIKGDFYVIPCCTDLKKFRYELRTSSTRHDLLHKLNLENKFNFIYSGSLGTWYMLEDMIDFFKHAKKTISNAHFLILTMSDHNIAKEAIKRKEQNASDFTILNIAPSEVQNYTCLGDAALIFIKPTFSKLSSSPTKFAEYLACGLPIIINSNIGDCDELVKSNNIGVIVRDFKESEYENSLKELNLLLKEGQDLNRRCHQVAEAYFPLKKGVNTYKEIYSSLIRGQ